jgi:hypothetical protein
MGAALRALDAVPVARLDGGEREQRACLEARFRSPEPPAPRASADRFVAETIAAYHDYWRGALLGEPAADAELRLARRLATLLGSSSDSLDDLTDSLGSALRARGYESIRGRTLPFYDLMMWKGRTDREYQAPLPGGPLSVKVVFLRDFVELGWSDFATCGRSHTGGWVGEDALYCVADAYDPASETFRVRFVAHEGQHFADRQRFPALEGPELEYRAKLVELALARTAMPELLETFADEASAGAGRDAPHAYAAARLMKDLGQAVFGHAVSDRRAWRAVSVTDVNRAARKLLEWDTRRLSAAHAEADYKRPVE